MPERSLHQNLAVTVVGHDSEKWIDVKKNSNVLPGTDIYNWKKNNKIFMWNDFIFLLWFWQLSPIEVQSQATALLVACIHLGPMTTDWDKNTGGKNVKFE